MDVKYIIESHYYNGDAFMDKVDTLDEVIEILQDIGKSDTDEYDNEHRIDSKQISVTTEEQ